ncbi:MAG: outer membrane protein assembly factor, partial [Polaribacter sp.]
MHFKSLVFILCILLPLGLFSQQKIILDIKIQGVEKTKPSFIKSLLITKKGDKLDSLSIEKDIILLKRLPAISHAYYQIFYSHDNFYNVFINIEENFTIVPEVNLWTTTNQQFSYKLGLYDYNFLG